MITALSNHFSRLLSPCLHLSAVVKRQGVCLYGQIVTCTLGCCTNLYSHSSNRYGFKHIIIRSIISYCQDKIISGGKQSLFTSEPLVNSGDFISITLLPCMICKFCFKQIDIKELTNCCARNLPNHASASR